MDGATLRIGELAQRQGVSTATLRYYERLGLLGRPDRTASGYRTYDHDHEARVRFIVRAKALDLSLDDIRALLDVWDAGSCSATRDRLRHVVAHKVAAARQRAEEAEAFAAQLTHVYDRLAQPATPRAGDGGCSCIPDLPVAPAADLEAELSRIAGTSCRCNAGGGWDAGAADDCGCCGPPPGATTDPTRADRIEVTAAGGCRCAGCLT